MTTIITFTFHDGEILKSEYIHVIALSGRKHIEIYRRGDSKKKKKRLIKEKMDIEKKRENTKNCNRNSMNFLRLMVTRS